MSELGSECGSAESRANGHGARMWALGSTCSLWAFFCLCACSGSTDVVGVVESNVTDVQLTRPSSSATPNPSAVQGAGAPQSSSDGTGASELLVVAGLPVHDYPGPIFEWPLDVRLRTFFSETVWPGHLGPPDQRDAFERMGSYSDQHHDDVRFIASTGDVAERLRDLFSTATALLRTEPRSVVTRDVWFDEYMVVLGTATCTDSSSHHGDPCAIPDPSAGADFNGGNSSGANLGAP